MSSVERRWEPFESVRLPLHARMLALQSDEERVVLGALDLLGLSGTVLGGWESFKQQVVEAANHAVTTQNLILTTTHTHSAPETLALTDLCQEPFFQHWMTELAGKLGEAIRDAVDRIQICYCGVGVVQVPGFSVYRRIKTTQGIMMSHPEPPPDIVLSRAGPVDNAVFTLAFHDTRNQPAALLVTAVCHPVYEMCIPRVSPDFPGEVSLALEHLHPDVNALFFNGCAANINPRSVSSGPVEAKRHAEALVAAVEYTRNNLQPVTESFLRVKRKTVYLPGRTAEGHPTTPLRTEIASLRIGEVVFVFLPGEVFVETGLTIQQNSPFLITIVVGYAEDYIGYIPTNVAFEEGGYETGPGQWCVVRVDSEEILCSAVLELLKEESDASSYSFQEGDYPDS